MYFCGRTKADDRCMEENKGFLRQDNNYRTLKAFQKAECIYDITFFFAHKFLKTGDRTIDQMIQAVRRRRFAASASSSSPSSPRC